MMTPVRVRLVALIPPLLLAVVALFGVWQHLAHDQSSWSGASFGMFATIDGEATRQVRAYLEGGGPRLPLTAPPQLDREIFEVQVLPTRERLAELGERWVEIVDFHPEAVLVLEVWGLNFEGSDAALSRFMIRRVEVTA